MDSNVTVIHCTYQQTENALVIGSAIPGLQKSGWPLDDNNTKVWSSNAIHNPLEVPVIIRVIACSKSAEKKTKSEDPSNA